MICKNKRWIGIVAAAVVLLTTAIGVLVYVQHATDLYDLQQEALAQLEKDAGQYDDQSIVLQNTGKAKAEELAELYGAELRITEDGRFATLTLPEGTTIRDVYAREESLPHIQEMSADYQARISDLTEEGDTYERLPVRPQTTLSDAEYHKQTYLDYLNLQNVWGNYTGRGVTVAVIDTGIDTDHPEFAGRISEYSYNATDDKIVKDYTGKNGGYDWSLIEDKQGHGTAVAGVIAASMNSGNVVGVAPNVNIVVIKAECDEKGVFKRTSDLVFGLYYAIERDVSVVNMSFGTTEPLNPFAEATQLAYDSDVICVAAAGNDATAALTWPAADPNVLGVGALAADSWEMADYSNYGENVNLVAPGTTYTTLTGGKYGAQNGTSLAAPITTGAIALYMQSDKTATFDKVTELLYASCTDLGDPGRDWYYGFGALDVYAFTKEARGTITYDMLTDELENTEGLFISGHTLQELPEPERLYAVFDGWYYDDTFTQEYVYYKDKFYDDVTLYAKWVNEDDGIPYTYVVLDDGTVEIRSYTGRRRYITIPEKIDGRIVSSIGDGAFKGQTGLREVTLPSGLVNIRREAFAGCSNLMTITIPAGVTDIGEAAFEENVRLYTVAFVGNSRLETIGDFAFAHCSSLEQMELPTKLEEINGSAFYGATALRSITVQKGNKNFTSYDGVLYNFTGGALVAFPANYAESYTLLNNTHVVGSYAFAYAKTKSVDLEKVKQIEDYAFVGSRLEEVEIPHQIKSLGVGAFYGNAQLVRVDLGDKLTEITLKTFMHCTSLREISIPDTVVVIGESAFANSGVEKVTFVSNSSLVRIDKEAFCNCRIGSISIPDSVVEIGSGAFLSSSIEEIVISKNSQLRRIGDDAFKNNYGLTQISLPSKLETIGSLAFAKTGLATVTIPAGVTGFGSGAFAYNPDLTEILVEATNGVYHSVDGVVYTKNNGNLIQYPAGKEGTTYTVNTGTHTIAGYAFSGTVNLTKAILPEGMEILSEYSFCDAGIQSVSLPTTLTEIQAYAFYRCGNLNQISIPDNVKQIGRFAVAECRNLKQVTFTENAKLPRISYAAFAYSGLQSFTVPANVSTIAQGAFEGCKSLTSFTFAAGSKLESISAYMFDGCTNLQTVTFRPGSALTSIQAHGLEGMDKLTSIDFGDAKLTNIDNFAFRFCESLSTLKLPNTLTNIGRYAFYGCESLAELSVPETMDHIGSYAFLGTKDVEVYFAGETLPLHLDENWDRGIKGYYTGVRSVTTGGDYKYAVLSSGNIAILEYLGNDTAVDLTAVDLGAPITIIGGSAFEDSTVTSIVLPSSLTTIQAEAFRYAELEEITIPANVTFIGREAFAHTQLNTLTFADGSQLSVMEQCAFEGTKYLREVILPASLQTMGTGAFRESGLESVTFAEDILLTEIPQQAFAFTKLTALALPDSVILVNHNAFNNVTTLQSVTFGRNEGIRLMSNAFYHTGLTSLHIPANVTYIGEYCFVALSDLTEFTVDAANPNYTAVDGLLMNKNARKLIAVPAGRTGSLTVPLSVEEIGFGAFEESQLSEVLFDKDANILTLGYRAFFKVENITEIHIPASVVSIDYYAFAYCENLQTVTFAEDNQLKGIYEGAFAGCIRLEDIMLPDSIVEISDFAFYGCSSLTEIPVSNTVNLKGIYSYAFAYTGISGELTTPANLYDIGDYAFMGTQVTKVTVPDTMQKQLIIGIGAFEKCNQLEEITLPFIGASFEDEEISWFGYIFGAGSYEANSTYVPQSVKTVTITEGIRAVYTGGFYGCAGLETINFPITVSALWNDAMKETTANYTLIGPVMTYWEKTTWPDKGSISTVAKAEHFGRGVSGELVLADGITEIDFRAFSDCTNLTNIIIPDSVTGIDHEAFKNCSGLINLVIPSSITSLDGSTFYNCSSLTSITIPNSVTAIGFNVFSGCTSLTDITIPESVTKIENSAFSECSSLTNITIPDSVLELGGSAFSGCSNLKNIRIPDGITSIEDFTFYGCSNLTSVTIPDSVTRIGSYAFYGCANMANITIPKHITSIGDVAFHGCTRLFQINNNSSLLFELGKTSYGSVAYYAYEIIDQTGNRIYKDGEEYIETADHFLFTNKNGVYTLKAYLGAEDTITLPQSINGCGYKIDRFHGGVNVIIPDGVAMIDAYAFERCENLVSVTIPKSVTYIGHHAFSYCENLTSVTLSEGLVRIDQRAFESCRSLTEITLPNSLKSIGQATFSMCSGLTTVHIPDGVTAIDSWAFSLCSDLTCVTIPNSVTTLGSYAFEGCYSLKSVTIPESVTAINAGVFSGCSSLTEIIIPDGVTAINASVFSGCSSLTEIIIPSGVTVIYNKAFFGCSGLTDITIPNTVTSIASNAFTGCSNLTSIAIPNSVQSIGGSAFPSSATVTIAKENEFFQSIDGVLYDRPATTIIHVPDTIVNLVIPEGTTSIADYMFKDYNNLASITLPDSITSIGYQAFQNCSALTDITIPNGVTQIPSESFSGCSNLMRITLPDGVTYIGTNAFSNCSSLSSITIPNSVTRLYNKTFFGCTNLKNVTIPSSVTIIGEDVFSGCSSLKSISIPNSVTIIGERAFYDCSSLMSITLPEGMTTIDEFTFANCIGLKSVTIPESVTTIDRYAFAWCDTLLLINNYSSLRLVLGETTYGSLTENALAIVDKNGNKSYRANESSKEYFETADHFLFVKENETYTLMAYLGDEENITLPQSIYGHSYGIERFRGGVNVIIPEGTTTINRNAFDGCKSLKSVVIPKGVTHIDSDAFADCTALTRVTLPDGLTNISVNAFFNCMALSEITIPNTVTRIGTHAFKNCRNLSSVNIPVSMSNISQGTFSGCSNLTEITIPDNITSISENVFENTGIMNNAKYWENGQMIIDHWLIKVDPDKKYLDNLDDITNIAFAAYSDAYKLKHAVWHSSANIAVNAETLYITQINSSITTLANLPITIKNIVICDTVDASDLRNCPKLFKNVSGITIFVEKLEQDLRWDANFAGWSNGNHVVYGDDWILANFYDENGALIQSEPRLNSQVIRLPIYKIAPDDQFTYELIGWDVDGDGEADSIPATAVVDVEAHPVVESTPRLYTARFEDRDTGVLYHSTQLSYGSVISLPVAPEKKGYSFIGWSGYNDGMTINGDVVFYASWRHNTASHMYAEPVWVEATCTEPGQYKHYCTICEEFYSVGVTVALGHAYEMTVIAPSCTDSGYTLHSCIRCGDSYTDAIVPATGHSYGDWVVDQPADCVTEGERHRKCTACGHQENGIIPITGHVFEIVDQTESTCTQRGKMTYRCTVCESAFVETLPLEPHTYQKRYAPISSLEWLIRLLMDVFWGCKGDQVYYYACDDCGHIQTPKEASSVQVGTASTSCRHSSSSWKTEVNCVVGLDVCVCDLCEERLAFRLNGSSTNHSFSEWGVTDEPTCLDKGEQRRDCIYCDHFEVGEIAALGHKLTQHNAKAPTCTEIGWNAYETCSRCDYTTYVEIPANGHAHDSVVTAPTCTEQGYTTHTCHCGDSYVDSYVSATSHSYGEWSVTDEPTCMEKGEQRRDCENCDHFETAEVAALGHSYGEWSVTDEPTCTEKGEQRRECENCDHFETAEVAALGHDLTQHKAQDPTCTEMGWDAYETCSRCDYATYVDLPAIGHDYESVITAPTCTKQGYTTHTCHCGDSYVDSYVPATGHSYTSKVTKKPTCTAAGVKTYTCSHCSHSYTESIAVKSHTWKNATCTKAKTCTVCGATSGKALGHKYAAATCTKAKTCTVCKATSGKKLGHTYTNACDTSCNRCKAARTVTHTYKTVTKKATISTNGYTVKRCSVCSKETGKTTIYKASSIKLSKITYTYNGKTQKPSVVIKDSKGKTISSSNYTVTYASGRKNVGKYKVTVKFKGNYSGTKTLYFTINPVKTTVKSLTAGSKKLTVNITKKSTQVTGYQIQYSTSKSFKSYKTKTVSSYKTTKATLTGLKAKTTYYVRVRTYKTVNGVKYYSGWSAIKYKKTK